jgi:hypothetical protein
MLSSSSTGSIFVDGVSSERRADGWRGGEEEEKDERGC